MKLQYNKNPRQQDLIVTEKCIIRDEHELLYLRDPLLICRNKCHARALHCLRFWELGKPFWFRNEEEIQCATDLLVIAFQLTQLLSKSLVLDVIEKEVSTCNQSEPLRLRMYAEASQWNGLKDMPNIIYSPLTSPWYGSTGFAASTGAAALTDKFDLRAGRMAKLRMEAP